MLKLVRDIITVAGFVFSAVNFATNLVLHPVIRWGIPAVTVVLVIARAIDLFRRTAREKPPQTEPRVSAYELNLSLFGFGYSELEVGCTIRENGSALIKRHGTVIANSNIRELPIHLVLPESDDDNPAEEPDMRIIRSTLPRRELQLGSDEETVWTLSRRKRPVRIEPELEPGEGLEFEIVETSPIQTFRTKQNQKQTDKPDYFFWDIIVPTKRLMLNVYLPEGTLAPNPSVEVYYSLGPPTQLNRNEMTHLEGKLETSQRKDHLRIVIMEPLLAMAYKIVWDPAYK